MVSWWGTDSYSKNKRIKMGDIEVMNSEYDSSGSFESRVRSIFVEHITYTGRRNNFRSKSTPIYGPVQKADLNHSFSRSHFSRLPQAFSKKNYCLSQKVNYSYCCCLFVVVFPATSSCGIPESWGGGVPTSGRDIFVPRLRWYLIISFLTLQPHLSPPIFWIFSLLPILTFPLQ